nr:MAG TPA: hypothetical protein [Caudoviricetes sp.]
MTAVRKKRRLWSCFPGFRRRSRRLCWRSCEG